MRRDPGLLVTLKLRARVLAAIREYFDGRGFVEVTTPSLVLAHDPALHLEPFVTTLHPEQGDAVRVYLPTSPEHHMKRMVAAGLPNIYQLAPFFRDGEMTPVHNPEFTGLEWYQAGAELQDTMELTEALVHNVARETTGNTRFTRNGVDLDLTPPYQRMSVREALRDFGDIQVPDDWDPAGLREALDLAGIRTDPDDRFDDLVHRAMLERVEPAFENLGPVLLGGYPAPMASQARLDPENRHVAERFELYIGGLELCNGYGELTDPNELRTRFESDRELRRRRGRHVPPLDEPYLEALTDLPACSGCALGVDRLIMLLAGKNGIDEVMAFPAVDELRSRRR